MQIAMGAVLPIHDGGGRFRARAWQAGACDDAAVRCGPDISRTPQRAAVRTRPYARAAVPRQPAGALPESRRHCRSQRPATVFRSHAPDRDRQQARGGGLRRTSARNGGAPSGRTAMMPARFLAGIFAAFVVPLAAIAWLSPEPNRVTDRAVYDATAARMIVVDC